MNLLKTLYQNSHCLWSKIHLTSYRFNKLQLLHCHKHVRTWRNNEWLTVLEEQIHNGKLLWYQKSISPWLQPLILTVALQLVLQTLYFSIEDFTVFLLSHNVRSCLISLQSDWWSRFSNSPVERSVDIYFLLILFSVLFS